MAKIVRCSVNTYWYADRIGETFMVVPHSSTSYRTQDHFYKGIDIEDCIRIPKEPETFEVRVTKGDNGYDWLKCRVGEVLEVEKKYYTDGSWFYDFKESVVPDNCFEVIPPYDKSRFRLLPKEEIIQKGDMHHNGTLWIHTDLGTLNIQNQSIYIRPIANEEETETLEVRVTKKKLMTVLDKIFDDAAIKIIVRSYNRILTELGFSLGTEEETETSPIPGLADEIGEIGRASCRERV